MRRSLLLITLFGLLALPGAAVAAPNVVGQVEEFPLGAGTRPEAMVAGPDGNLWFVGVQYLPGSNFADVVGKVTPGGKVTEFQVDVHSGNLGLSDIAVGPDGNLWFTVGGRPKVGRITTAGQVTEFELPSAGASPASIVAGSDGNLWFTEWQGGKVGRITPSGEATEFPLMDGRFSSGIAAGPDGATELPVPGGRQTFALSSGPYGDVWYSNGGGRIGWVIPGVLTGTAACINSCRAPITALAAGPDGKLWFAAGVESGVLSPLRERSAPTRRRRWKSASAKRDRSRAARCSSPCFVAGPRRGEPATASSVSLDGSAARRGCARWSSGDCTSTSAPSGASPCSCPHRPGEVWPGAAASSSG